MGILTADDSLIDAALSEILAMSIDQKHSLDPQRHVDYLLLRNHLAQVSTDFIYKYNRLLHSRGLNCILLYCLKNHCLFIILTFSL